MTSNNNKEWAEKNRPTIGEMEWLKKVNAALPGIAMLETVAERERAFVELGLPPKKGITELGENGTVAVGSSEGRAYLALCEEIARLKADVEAMHLIVQGVKHYPQCNAEFADHGDCMRCRLAQAREEIARLEAERNEEWSHVAFYMRRLPSKQVERLEKEFKAESALTSKDKQ